MIEVRNTNWRIGGEKAIFVFGPWDGKAGAVIKGTRILIPSVPTNAKLKHYSCN